MHGLLGRQPPPPLQRATADTNERRDAATTFALVRLALYGSTGLDVPVRLTIVERMPQRVLRSSFRVRRPHRRVASCVNPGVAGEEQY